MISALDKNSLVSGLMERGVARHVEIHRCLIHVANGTQWIVPYLPHSYHVTLEA